MKRTFVLIVALIANYANADPFQQPFGSSKYENKTV